MPVRSKQWDKDYLYDSTKFFSEKTLGKICELRVNQPELIQREMSNRKRRRPLTRDGKLTILAADHPGRMVTGVGDDPVALGDRLQYLGRILRVLVASEIDGVMGTSDVLEDVVLANYLYRQKHGKSFLDERVMLGCTNRGGLSGMEAEMRDMMTSYTNARYLKQMNLDGAKLMLRLTAPAEKDNLCLETQQAIAQMINELGELGIPAFLEVLMVERREGRYRTVKEANALIKVVGVATALGYTSAGTWLKLPYCEGYERVARATTCPILMLGGEATGRPVEIVRDFSKGMLAGANVRGALVGRNVTFPGNEDPAVIAQAINLVVHKGLNADKAVDSAAALRGAKMNVFP